MASTGQKIALGLGGIGLLGAAAATAFYMNTSSPEETGSAAQTTATTQETQQPQRATTPSARSNDAETLVFTFNDLQVTRPNGVTLTVSAIAACGAMVGDFNLSNATQLAAYEQACLERTQARLDYAMCEYANPAAHFATNNPEIRAMSLGRDVASIGENLLWDEGELSRAAAHKTNSLSVTSVSSLEDARPIEDFVRPEGCSEFAFRGGPKPF